MSGGTENENCRRIDKMEGDFEKSEIRREKDRQIQEEQMTAMRSNLAESLARNEAANQAANARLESKVEAQGKDAQEKFVDLHKTVANLHSTIMFATFGIIASVGVAAALLGLFLRSSGGGG